MRISSYLQALIKIHYKGGLSMKKEVILVPKDKCPLDVLSEMGERTKNSWIFIHEDVVIKLVTMADYETEEKEYQELLWDETEEYPATTIDFEIGGIWHRVYRIIAEDIAFECESPDPEEIIFLKMAE